MSEDETVVVEQLGNTDMMRREINRGLMVTWINAGLSTRSHHDVRHSIVIYDEDKLFLTACSRETWANPETAGLAHKMGGRFWSKGIV